MDGAGGRLGVTVSFLYNLHLVRAGEKGVANFNFVDDDGFTIYLDDAEAKQLVYDHAKKVEKLNKK